MAAKDARRAQTKADRDGRKAVARAGSGGRSVWSWIGAAVVVLAAVVVVVLTVTSPRRHTGPTGSASLNNPPATVAIGNAEPPPWPAPADAAAAVSAAGLPMLGSEGNVEHLHAHLNVLADNQPVHVPANIGIDRKHGTISPLHTHDGSGVIHIESPVKRQFTLGELFSEWQVSLSATNIGGLRVDNEKVMRVFVNGAQQSGNPAAVPFGAHDEIAVIYGTPRPGETIPSTYKFAEGE